MTFHVSHGYCKGTYDAVLLLTDLEPDDVMAIKVLADKLQGVPMLVVVGEGNKDKCRMAVDVLAHYKLGKNVNVVQGVQNDKNFPDYALTAFESASAGRICYTDKSECNFEDTATCAIDKFLKQYNNPFALILKPPFECLDSDQVLLKKTVAAMYGSFNAKRVAEKGETDKFIEMSKNFKKFLIVERALCVGRDSSINATDDAKFWKHLHTDDVPLCGLIKSWNRERLTTNLNDILPGLVATWNKENKSNQLDDFPTFDDVTKLDALRAWRITLQEKLESEIDVLKKSTLSNVDKKLAIIVDIYTNKFDQLCSADPIVAAILLWPKDDLVIRGVDCVMNLDGTERKVNITPFKSHVTNVRTIFVNPESTSAQSRFENDVFNVILGAAHVTTTAEKTNILLMTDGYKFSHHKQYPVSWMPEPMRINTRPPVLFDGVTILKLLPVPGGKCERIDLTWTAQLTIVTSVSTAVVDVTCFTEKSDSAFNFTGESIKYDLNHQYVRINLAELVVKELGLDANIKRIQFENVDTSKEKIGSEMNKYSGGYNVSYFTCRGYKDTFDGMKGDNIVFFGLQYFMKEYLEGVVVTKEKVDEAEAFVSHYMANCAILGPSGYDYTMFPRGDWMAMVSGDYDDNGDPNPDKAGVLPIKIEALPEGTLVSPNVCCFKITNTHPRFFWLPNFLETLLVQIWYPTTVATQTRQFRKTIQAYSYLSQRKYIIPTPDGMDAETYEGIFGEDGFTIDDIVKNKVNVRIGQVFDLLDFGYRGVSSHETAAIGSAAYYTAGYEGSDTVAGARMCLRTYDDFKNIFDAQHGATSVPASEHSTITSWPSQNMEYVQYNTLEYYAFCNMFKQYMPSFCVSLVSDGFNIWNAIARQWSSTVEPIEGESMHAMLKTRLETSKLSLIRPDSGEGIETLPQILTLLHLVLGEHFMEQDKLSEFTEKFPMDGPRKAKFEDFLSKVQSKVYPTYDTEKFKELKQKNNLGEITDPDLKAQIETLLKIKCELKTPITKNPFRRFKGQQMRVLQGDGVAINTIGDMLASLLSNGFCASTVNFGSGGGLLQKVHRDTLSVAFKCCAMYVGDEVYAISKDPIAGGKKSYAGNPCVIRNTDGILENRKKKDGDKVVDHGMTFTEFTNGVEGDELVTVFDNGRITKSQLFSNIRANAKITEEHLNEAIAIAVDTLYTKVDFFQKMTSEEAIAVRLAEASCGAKWSDDHELELVETLSAITDATVRNNYKTVLTKMGITESMTTTDLTTKLKETYVCSTNKAKNVLQTLEYMHTNPEGAANTMGKKVVLTL